VRPDADHDGWRANADCDDNDATVNPGRPEVLGNGKDDDCDPATTDTGSAPTAAFNPQTAGSRAQRGAAGGGRADHRRH
jgi:hypothetical protein